MYILPTIIRIQYNNTYVHIRTTKSDNKL